MPTRNGGIVAVETLMSVVGQLGPGDELIVVDDGSDDGTTELVAEWLSSACPQGQLLHLDHGGASRARNAALEAARTDIVCFLDHDEFADDDWVANLRTAWGTLGSRVGAIGGPMLPVWPCDRPPWLHDDMLHVVSILDLGRARHRLGLEPFTGHLWAGNMSVRVAPALEVGGFDPTLGPGPEQTFRHGSRYGEEEELQDRLAAAGWEIWYEPSAAIRHRLTPDRVRAAYFRQAYRLAGQLDVQAGKGRAAGGLSVLKAALRVPRALIRPGHGEIALASFDFTYGLARLFGPVLP